MFRRHDSGHSRRRPDGFAGDAPRSGRRPARATCATFRAVPGPIPFHKPSITQAEIDSVSAVLRSGWLTTGPKAKELEVAVTKYVAGGARGSSESAAPFELHAVALSSCTAALHLALIAAGVGAEDEVVTSPYTFVSTGETILYLGAKPVFVDVEPPTKNLDPAKLESAITPRTKAVVATSIAGHPCRIEEIVTIARRRGIPVIEDAAHSLTARIGKAAVGTQADITCFSFYATKGVTSGEGGMAVTTHKEWADRIRRLCLHGLSDAAWSRYGSNGWWEYDVTELGYKYNLTDIQAALALTQMARAEELRSRRESIARRYDEALRGIPGLTTPAVAKDVRHAWHLYQIAVAPDAMKARAPGTAHGRTALALALREDGIGTSVHFKPLHLFHYYQERLGLRAGQFPVAERCYAETLSLPIFPDLTDAEIDHVAERVRHHMGASWT
jgi:dTDP-4-amino-4,6-dideoxygalactose transaminase